MSTVLKRQPTQARSQQRRQRILSATAELLDEIDYATVSVATIADRAETSVGSIYQFFPNKDAVLRALAEIYLQDMYALLTHALLADGAPLERQIERVIRWLMDYMDAHPGFHQVLKSEWVSPEIKAAVQSMHNTMSAAVAAALSASMPHVDAARVALVSEVGIGIANGVLPLVVAMDGEKQACLAEELKRALLSYLIAATQ